ncbi:MAG: chaperone NapD [Phycisphaerales bacterium]
MAIVGAFARVDTAKTESCKEAINMLAGVSTFELDDPHKVGILVESGSLNEAHDTIAKTIRSIQGVLGVWPVYVNTEDEQELDQQVEQEATTQQV